MATSKLLPVIYVGKSLTLTRTEAWLWVRVPHTNVFMKSVAEHETVAVSLATALRSTLGEGEEAVDFHIRSVNRAFDLQSWYDQFLDRTARYNPPPAAAEFARLAALRLEATSQYNLLSQTYLGIRLGKRNTSSATGAVKSTIAGLLGRVADATSGLDVGVDADELQQWGQMARTMQFTLANAMSGSKAVTPDELTVPAAELMWLLRKPFFPTYGCPDVDIPQTDPDFGGDTILELTPSDVTVQPRHMDVTYANPSTGTEESFATSICCLSEFSRYTEWPQRLGWAALVQDKNPNVEWSIRGRVVSAAHMKAVVKKNTVMVNREIDDAEMARVSPGARLVEQAHESASLEHLIADSSEPWLEVTYRLQVRGADAAELNQHVKNLQTALQQANMRLQRPPHDQLPLLLEFLPGAPWQESLYKRTQSYFTVGAGGLTASYHVGDETVLGPYLGRVIYGDTPPVFYDPNRAIALNSAPVTSITGTPGTGKRLWTGTPIPTPTGWTTMGELAVGSRVFDDRGQPCRVTHVTPVEWAPRSFKVTFSDGSVLLADGDHRWVTHTRAALANPGMRVRAGRGDRSSGPAQVLLSALADLDPDEWSTPAALVTRFPGGPEKRRYDQAAQDLRNAGQTPRLVPVQVKGVTVHAQLWPTRDLVGRVLERLLIPGAGPVRYSELGPTVRTTDEIRASLMTDNGLPNHAIAAAGALQLEHQHERATWQDTVARTRALDAEVQQFGSTHGTVTEVRATDAEHARRVHELACTLGLVPHMNPDDVTLTWDTRTRYRFITSVEPVDPLPMLCITVDSPSHLYLAGESFIPTHNTFLALSMAYQCAARGYHVMYLDPKADAIPFAHLPGLGDVTLFDLQEGAAGMLDPFRLGEDIENAGLLALEVLTDLAGGVVNEARESALSNAINYVKVRPQPSLWAVVERLNSFEEGTAEYNLGARLSSLRKVAFGRLLFSPDISGEQLRASNGLTVVTLLGLDTPSASTPPEEYTFEQRIGSAVMFLLTKYAYNLMAQGDPNFPKALFVDEAWSVLGTAAGRRMVESIGRMGRSRNTSLTLISQDVTDFAKTTIGNQVSTRFVFGSTNAEEHPLMLKYLDVEESGENLQLVSALTRQDWRGRCLMKDALGRVGLIQVDAYRQDLFEAFNTNPETRKSPTQQDGRAST